MTIFEQERPMHPDFSQPSQMDIHDDQESGSKLRKRQRVEDISQGTIETSRKRQKTGSKYLIKRIDYPQIMTRDEAFQVGLRHTSKKVQKIIGSLTKEEREELGITKKDLGEPEPTRTEKPLTDDECILIESIGKTYSQTLSSQLLELTALCKKGPKDNATKVLAFAQENEQHEAKTEKEAKISRVLGNLLFLADIDVTSAASCLNSVDLDECSEELLHAAHEQMKSARENIDSYEELLINTAVHDIGQALNHFTSIELAKHLLLSNGSFNIEFIDDAIDALIPETLEKTEAIRTSYYILGNLAASPLGAMKIYKAKLPNDKNLPSYDLVRATLQIDHATPIKPRDVQVTILSGIIENVRQAKAGSCFATSWLITLLHKHIDMVIEDFTDCLEEGKITRRIDNESKSIPFQLRTSREGLDIELTIDTRGRLIKKEPYFKNPDEMKHEPLPTGRSYIWDVPGITAACRVLGFKDVRAAVSKAIHQLGTLTFTPKELLKALAAYSFQKNSRIVYRTRTARNYSMDELIGIAQYAFGVQSRHALHSAWEQMAAASVSYLSSQFAMSLWVYDALKESLSIRTPAGTDPKIVHRYKHMVLDAVLLPMISRMRYRYNHYIEEDKRFFEGNKGVYSIGFYGYELCDTGLPEDFEYSSNIARALRNGSSYLFYSDFKEYPRNTSGKR